jgi:hypothetical protein
MRVENKTPEELTTQYAKVRKLCPDIFNSIDVNVDEPISFLRKKYRAEYDLYLALLRYIGHRSRPDAREEEKCMSRSEILDLAREGLKLVDIEHFVDSLISSLKKDFPKGSYYIKSTNKKGELYVTPPLAARIKAEISSLVEFTNDFSSVSQVQDAPRLIVLFEEENPEKVRRIKFGRAMGNFFILHHQSVFDFIRDRRGKLPEKDRYKPQEGPFYHKHERFLRSLGIQGNLRLFLSLADLLNFRTEINDCDESRREKIEEWIAKVKKWDSASSLAQRFSLNEAQMMSILKYYQGENIVEVVFLEPGDMEHIYISPALIEHMNNEISPPSNWFPEAVLQEHFQHDPRAQKILASSKGQMPDHFQPYWRPQENFMVRESFAGPQAIDHLLNALNPTVENALLYTIENLAIELQRDQSALKAILKNMARMWRSSMVTKYIKGKLVDHYGENIIAELKKKLPPPNDLWMTAEQIAEEYDMSREEVIRKMKRIGAVPISFYSSQGKQEPFYAPESIEGIS